MSRRAPDSATPPGPSFNDRLVKAQAMKEEWQVRHELAMLLPNKDELMMVTLLRVIEAMVPKYRADAVLRHAVADLIEGARALLNGDWGDRLDKGTIDTQLEAWARRIGYCLAHSKTRDECKGLHQ